MTNFIPHDYQEYAIQEVVEKPATGLFLDMGLRQNNYHVNGSI